MMPPDQAHELMSVVRIDWITKWVGAARNLCLMRRGSNKKCALSACVTLPGHRAVTLPRRDRRPRHLLRIAVAVCAAAFFLIPRGASVAPLGAQTSRAPSTDGLDVLEVRPNVFLIAGAGGNVAVQVGKDGVVVVDAGSTDNAAALVAAIKK